MYFLPFKYPTINFDHTVYISIDRATLSFGLNGNKI